MTSRSTLSTHDARSSSIQRFIRKSLAPGTEARTVEALQGDAVLKLLLSMHCPHDGEQACAAGQLHDFIVRHSTNYFLYQRHLELFRENDLPEDLPPPRGQATADPTCFEAWIGRVFKRNGGGGASRFFKKLPKSGVRVDVNAFSQ